MSNLTKLRLRDVLGTLSWVFYLGLLCWMATVTQRYDDRVLASFGALSFLFMGCYLCFVISGVKYNSAALVKARIPIVLALLALLWQLTQSFLPVQSSSLFDLMLLPNSPEWLQPQNTISVVSAESRWILLVNFLVFAWMLLSLCIITSRNRVKQLLLLVTVMGCAHALIGIFTNKTGLLLVERGQLDGHFDLARGLFVNRNHFAAFISLSMLGAITMLLQTLINNRQRRFLLGLIDTILSPKIFYIIAPLLMIIAILWSQSRAGIFGLVVASLFVTLALIFADIITKRNRNYLLGFLSLTVATIMLFGQTWMNRLGQEWFVLGERTLQWQITWKAISESPILGFGTGSYSTVFQFFRDQSELREVVFDQAHNEYLHVWLEQGLIGLVLWVVLFAVVLTHALKQVWYHPSRFVRAASAAICIVLLAALAQALVDFNFQILNIRVLVFIFLALLYVLPTVSKRHH